MLLVAILRKHQEKSREYAFCLVQKYVGVLHVAKFNLRAYSTWHAFVNSSTKLTRMRLLWLKISTTCGKCRLRTHQRPLVRPPRTRPSSSIHGYFRNLAHGRAGSRTSRRSAVTHVLKCWQSNLPPNVASLATLDDGIRHFMHCPGCYCPLWKSKATCRKSPSNAEHTPQRQLNMLLNFTDSPDSHSVCFLGV